MERRALQIILALLSLIPLAGLALAWLRGPQFFFHGAPGSVPNALDNQFRYLAGVYVGAVTFGLWWAIPRIEERGAVLVLAAGAVVLGGIGRCVSMAAVGSPGDPGMMGGLVLELVVVPLLVLWQRRIARAATVSGAGNDN
jgi:hypothetical protein